jgi:SNF2 family DNA or RNA helicase
MISYGKLELVGDRWILTDIPPHVAIRLKNMFQRIDKTTVKKFSMPASDPMTADLAWFMERYPFEMSEKDAKWMKRAVKRFKDDRAATEAILLPGWQAPPSRGFRPGYGLRFQQMQADQLIERRKRLLLGDDVGLGKSWISMSRQAKAERSAVIVPAHLPSQWVNKFIVPYTELRAHIIDGTQPYSLPDADTYVFRYSNIHGWVDIAATGMFKHVTFDEIHDLRTGTETEKGRAAKVFADNAHEVLGMSATPIFNYGSEIHNIMRFIDPDVLGPWDEFTREWCVMGNNDKWLVREPDALGSYLRESSVFLRRVRQGRPINRIIIDVDYDHGKAAETESLARILALRVMNGSFSEAGQAARDLDALARRVTGIAKAKSVAAYAKLYLSAGIPIILAGWHRSVYEIWLKELAEFRPVMYTGSETGKQKDKAVADFVSGKTDLFIISLNSGAGIDGLQKRCSTVIVGELSWSPQTLEQLFGRVDREGQAKDEITAVFCTCDFGSDPTVIAVNAIKRDQARGITDPGVGVVPVHTDVSHIKQLALDYIGRTGG